MIYNSALIRSKSPILPILTDIITYSSGGDDFLEMATGTNQSILYNITKNLYSIGLNAPSGKFYWLSKYGNYVYFTGSNNSGADGLTAYRTIGSTSYDNGHTITGSGLLQGCCLTTIANTFFYTYENLVGGYNCGYGVVGSPYKYEFTAPELLLIPASRIRSSTTFAGAAATNTRAYQILVGTNPPTFTARNHSASSKIILSPTYNGLYGTFYCFTESSTGTHRLVGFIPGSIINSFSSDLPSNSTTNYNGTYFGSSRITEIAPNTYFMLSKESGIASGYGFDASSFTWDTYTIPGTTNIRITDFIYGTDGLVYAIGNNGTNGYLYKDVYSYIS